MKKGLDHIGVTTVYFCHDGEGNFLLSKRSKNTRDEQGTWDPGGGAVEFGDAVIDTLKREIKEEYCTEVLEHQFLGYMDVHRKQAGQKTHWIALVFKVLVDRNQVKNGEPDKFDDLEWFTLDNLPSPLHSQFPYALQEFGEKLRKPLSQL